VPVRSVSHDLFGAQARVLHHVGSQIGRRARPQTRRQQHQKRAGEKQAPYQEHLFGTLAWSHDTSHPMHHVRMVESVKRN
jgi:hypothetical protein